MNNLKIILVEDNPIDAEMTRRSLEKFGVDKSKITWLKDGEIALDFILRYSKDIIFDDHTLILLDLKMPKIDGFEVLEKIKLHPSTKHIPVIMMTSSTDERDKLRSYSLGANGFIVKCVDYEEFQHKIQKMNDWVHSRLINNVI